MFPLLTFGTRSAYTTISNINSLQIEATKEYELINWVRGLNKRIFGSVKTTAYRPWKVYGTLCGWGCRLFSLQYNLRMECPSNYSPNFGKVINRSSFTKFTFLPSKLYCWFSGINLPFETWMLWKRGYKNVLTLLTTKRKMSNAYHTWQA